MALSIDVESTKEYNVVVTGFAPWDVEVLTEPVNASWLVVNALPRVIFRNDKPNIRITILPHPVTTAWTYVRELVPQLWDGNKETFRLYVDPEKSKYFKIDAMLHMGINLHRCAPYALERFSYRDGFKGEDVNGKVPNDEDKTGGGKWKSLPERLSTDFNVDAIHSSVTAQAKDAEITISEDPGQFLCGYIYYSSLAELSNRGKRKTVQFLHIPYGHQNALIERGSRVARSVIEAMVDGLEADSLIEQTKAGSTF